MAKKYNTITNMYRDFINRENDTRAAASTPEEMLFTGTGGEWKIAIHKGVGLGGLDEYVIKDEENKLLAIVYGNSTDNIKANAALIAQSKNMYEALKDLVSLSLSMWGDKKPEIQKAKEIISRVQHP